MRCFYYRAYDREGNKRSGTINAPNRYVADATLRQEGLRPYLVKEWEAVQKAVRAHRRRQRILAATGGAAIALAILLSGRIVEYAGRERAPDIGQYRKTGLVEDGSGLIVAKTKEEREFAREIFDLWEGMYPGLVTGIEVKKMLMTVYVTDKIYNLSDSELELLASNAVRALHRSFKSSTCTLLIIEGAATVVDVNYLALTDTVRINTYR